MATNIGLYGTRSSYYAQNKALEAIVSEMYDKTPAQFPNMFTEIDNNPERSSLDIGEYAEMGVMHRRNEFEVPRKDAPYELIPAHFNFFTYALEVEFSEEAQTEDPMHMMGEAGEMFAFSEQNTEDRVYSGTYNLAWNPSYALPDGQPLISSSHILDPVPGPTGPISAKNQPVFSNSLTNVSMSPEAVNAAITILQNMLSARGLAIARDGVRLVIPANAAMMQVAREITGSEPAPNTTDGRINPEYQALAPYAYRYFVWPNGWFVTAARTALRRGMSSTITSHKWRNKVRTWYTDNNGSWHMVNEFRSTFGPRGWRDIVGSQGGGPLGL